LYHNQWSFYGTLDRPDPAAEHELHKLDPKAARRIPFLLHNRVTAWINPR
jgi:hypothetical protein